MKTKKFDGLKVMSPKFRMSFPDLLKPRSFEGKDPTYSIAMLFPPDADLKEMKRKATAAAKEKWADKVPKKLKTPFRDASELDYDGYEEDWTLVRASSKVKPGLVDADLEDVIDPGEIYPGRWARAILVPFAYDTAGNKGVSFGLRGVQLLEDDEQFGGGGFDKNDFDTGDNDTDKDIDDSGDPW